MDWAANQSTGKKRPPNSDGDDDLITEQPLSKKLANLSLRMEEKFQNHRDQLSQKQRKSVLPPDERMEVDNDNSNVVFIRDIDEELGSDDDDDDKKGLIFVRDIEKRLTRVPYDIASGRSSGGSETSSGTSTALVLYTVPSSLTVSKEQDGVRRAIVEARARIRQKQIEDARQQSLIGTREMAVVDIYGVDPSLGQEDDSDAMDIE